MATEQTGVATTGAQSEEFIRDFADRFLAAWNSRTAENVLGLTQPDVEWHDPSMPAPMRGQTEVRDWLEATWRALPDLAFVEVQAPFGSFDALASAGHWRMTGTFMGPFDPPGFAPTGGPVEVEGVDLWDFRDGRLERVRSFYDVSAMARQIGALPPRGSRGEEVGVAVQKLRARAMRR